MTVLNDANIYLAGVVQIPSALEITNITKAIQMVVTTTENTSQDNTYIAGQLVKLMIPITYGMFQADGLIGKVVSVSGSDITLNINSVQFDTFTTPSAGQLQPATLSPFGSRNLEFSNTTSQVPFQSLNNIGN